MAKIDAPTFLDRRLIIHALSAGSAARTGRAPSVFRNHFYANPGHSDWEALMRLCGACYMKDHGMNPIANMHLFTVTEEGARAAGLHLPRD